VYWAILGAFIATFFLGAGLLLRRASRASPR
jgi:hypothetical protein